MCSRIGIRQRSRGSFQNKNVSSCFCKKARVLLCFDFRIRNWAAFPPPTLRKMMTAQSTSNIWNQIHSKYFRYTLLQCTLGLQQPNPRKFQKILENSREFQKILKNSREFQKILKNSRKYQKILDSARKSQKTLRNPRKYQKIKEKNRKNSRKI